jgi:hypothetical protein
VLGVFLSVAVNVADIGLLIPTMLLLFMVATAPVWAPGNCPAPCDSALLAALLPWSAVVLVGWVTYAVHSVRRRRTPVVALLVWAAQRLRP